tara:strand:+ start:6428 stop:7468 length:1041 start_codon:yes stop_codon:yes gene_type:complete
MTLIIGCVTKEFGIIAGDTQLSSGDLARGEFDRIIQFKVNRFGPNFMMGILGKWNYISAMEDGSGTMIDCYKTLTRALGRNGVQDKLAFLNDFLPKQDMIEATSIYVRRNGGVFELDCVTSDGNTKTIKRITIGGRSFIFNEPFYEFDPNLIEGLIREFCDRHNLSDNLQDSIFLLNNIVLEIIARGKHLDISVNKETHIDIPNSVGGYVTLQIMNGSIHHQNKLFSVYSDPKVFLDKTTYPFARAVDQTRKINYADNLAMLVRSSVYPFNNIGDELKEVVLRQLEFVQSSEIMNVELLNGLIDTVNGKYGFKLKNIAIEADTDNLYELNWDEPEEEDNEFYKRFF